MTKSEYEDFLNLKLEDFSYINILGTSNFSETLKNLDVNIKKLLDYSIKIVIQNDGKIPNILISHLDGAINTINNFTKTISEFATKWSTTYDQNVKQSLLSEPGRITNSINNYVQQVYNPQIDRERSSNINNLLSILSIINTYKKEDQKINNELKIKISTIDSKLKEIGNVSNNLDKKIDETDNILKEKSTTFENKIDEANKILEDLRTEASKKVVYNYSNIFLEEASKHSGYNSKRKLLGKFGSAEKWLFTGIFTILVTITFVIVMYMLFPILREDKLDIPNLVTKISLLSILIFFISFSFKQYSINKHLYTLNKHRENVLNSYQLFLSTVGEEDTNIRNVLMMEVAKAIYEHGKTGFVSEKDGDYNSPSIVEISKFLTKDK